MISLLRTCVQATALIAVIALAFAGVASAAEGKGAEAVEPGAEAVAPEEGNVPRAKLSVRLRGDGKIRIGKDAKARGTLKPYVAGERVAVTLKRSGKAVATRNAKVKRIKGTDAGRFKFSAELIEPGSYKVTAVHKRSSRLGEASGKTRRFSITYPSLRSGSHGNEVRILNRLLDDLGYVAGSGSKYGGPTERAVLAYRKVNNMARTTNTTPGIFRALAAGKGGFKLADPGKGKQIEVDISRQVMALAVDGEAKRIYHVSTGAAATPTVRGKWTFYRRTPGYNAIGMYWSSFWVRGYAIHGYKSVPTHPASHGCVRTHLSVATSIYDWIDDGPSGTTIYTYG